ncbi:hypothetical protein N7488_011587 [Penicillium malachiteum]|nr:hypothetical protein N7488_011587 [Penicillium malachiteum]
MKPDHSFKLNANNPHAVGQQTGPDSPKSKALVDPVVHTSGDPPDQWALPAHRFGCLFIGGSCGKCIRGFVDL